jgi:PKD repeat protein
MNTPGDYTLTFKYDDFLGRPYSYSGPVHVLDPSKYKAIVALLTSHDDLQANFVETPAYGGGPLYVTFHDVSNYNPTSWVWTFGDGTGSRAQNPTHLFKAPGTYTVTLLASGSGTTVQSQRTVVVSACPNNPVRRVGGSDYSTPQTAYNAIAAPATAELRMQAVSLSGLSLNKNVTLKLTGGYDCTYSVRPDRTTLQGSLVIGGYSATVQVDSLIIQ